MLSSSCIIPFTSCFNLYCLHSFITNINITINVKTRIKRTIKTKQNVANKTIWLFSVLLTERCPNGYPIEESIYSMLRFVFRCPSSLSFYIVCWLVFAKINERIFRCYCNRCHLKWIVLYLFPPFLYIFIRKMLGSFSLFVHFDRKKSYDIDLMSTLFSCSTSYKWKSGFIAWCMRFIFFLFFFSACKTRRQQIVNWPLTIFVLLENRLVQNTLYIFCMQNAKRIRIETYCSLRIWYSRIFPS